jgi:endonuclease V-like protein UPF0215 family
MRNILHTLKRSKANCIGHILCRDFLLKHVTEGEIEVGGEDIQEDVSSYLMTLRKIYGTGN